MMYEDDRNKFKSRQYHKIIVDEASEILKVKAHVCLAGVKFK